MQYSEKDTIKFSTNWNGKLNNHYFTTIRLSNPRKYQVGKDYAIELRQVIQKHPVQLISKKTFTLDKINDFIAYIDTGYPPDKAKEMLCNMYKHKVTDIDNTQFDMLLLKKLYDKRATHEETLFTQEGGLP